jgi:divalent metal cation (Fe/Co/Zn/Cd) transporter
MLGVTVERDLARSIKKEITIEQDIQGAYDLKLHDYGPDKYLGSVHIEVADTLSVADIDKMSRRISKDILEKYGVILHTIGVYSVNTKDKEVIEVKRVITDIVFSHEGILEMHGFYLDKEEKTINFDIIIDFEVPNREEIYKEIYDEVKEKYKDYQINITLDVDISD